MSHRRTSVAYVLRAFPRLSETFILGEIVTLQRRGVDVRVFALERVRERCVHAEAERMLPHVTWVPELPEDASAAPAPRRLRAAWSAGRWIGERLAGSGVRHIHAHFAGPAATAAAAAAEVAGLPFSFTAHAKDIFAESVDWSWLREVGARARAVVTVCDYNRRFLVARLPARARVVRIHNGVDLERWSPARGRPARPHLLGVGRLVPKKGFDVLIDALALLQSQGVPFRATLIGDGVERQRLAAQARRLGLGRRLRLVGSRTQPQVRRAVRGATALVLPCVVTADGNQDALPTVLLEAGACGIPAVATRVAGIPEIVEHGRTGMLVAPGDPRALARALRRVLESRALAARLGLAARRRIERRFDRRAAGESLEALFTRSETAREGVERHAHRPALS